jgi:hypothetical protein
MCRPLKTCREEIVIEPLIDFENFEYSEDEDYGDCDENEFSE